MTILPGGAAQHMTVSDQCRRNWTTDTALAVAVDAVALAAKTAAAGWPIGAGAKFHFVLAVERPDRGNSPAAAAGALVAAAAELVRQAAVALSGTGWSGELSNEASDLHDLARRVAAG